MKTKTNIKKYSALIAVALGCLGQSAYAQTTADVAEVLIPSMEKRVADLYACFASHVDVEITEGQKTAEIPGRVIRIDRTYAASMVAKRRYVDRERDALEAAFIQRLLDRVGAYAESKHTDEEFAASYLRQRFHIWNIGHVTVNKKLLVQLSNAIASLRCVDASPEAAAPEQD